MTDKVITTVNQALIDDAGLAALLSKNSFGDSAVYESWAERESTFPYIVLHWNIYRTEHWAKKDGELDVDIFTPGPSTILAENIQTRVEEVLDRQLFESNESGPIRVYLNNATIVPDEEEVVHMIISFSILFWRKEFIQQLV